MKNFKCQHCGVCCNIDPYLLCLGDTHRWKREGREDILEHVRWKDKYPVGFKRKENKCPFYDGSKKENCCLIEKTKPNVCVRFPLSKNHAMSYTKGKCKGFGKKI